MGECVYHVTSVWRTDYEVGWGGGGALALRGVLEASKRPYTALGGRKELPTAVCCPLGSLLFSICSVLTPHMPRGEKKELMKNEKTPSEEAAA